MLLLLDDLADLRRAWQLRWEPCLLGLVIAGQFSYHLLLLLLVHWVLLHNLVQVHSGVLHLLVLLHLGRRLLLQLWRSLLLHHLLVSEPLDLLVGKPVGDEGPLSALSGSHD